MVNQGNDEEYKATLKLRSSLAGDKETGSMILECSCHQTHSSRARGKNIKDVKMKTDRVVNTGLDIRSQTPNSISHGSPIWFGLFYLPQPDSKFEEGRDFYVVFS